MPKIAPDAVRIPPERQRSTLETADLEESISRRGQIQPIVVTRDLVLVAGQRRLTACQRLGIEVEYIFTDEVDSEVLQDLELEENIKRQDLPWQDQYRAIARLHARLCARQDSAADSAARPWSAARTAAFIGYSATTVGEILNVEAAMREDARIAGASSGAQAASILRRISERQVASLVSDIIAKTQASGGSRDNGITETSAGDSALDRGIYRGLVPDAGRPDSRDDSRGHDEPPAAEGPNSDGLRAILRNPTAGGEGRAGVESRPSPILCADFVAWAREYSGPKFNLIHCDFPYGVSLSGNFGLLEGGNAGGERRLWESGRGDRGASGGVYANNPRIYWDLFDAFVDGFDRFASYSCHVIFWFSMNFYEETKRRLESLGLHVFAHPFIWHHSNGQGMVVHHGMLKRLYDVAFIAVRNERPLVRQLGLAYAAPTVANPVHPSQKPDGMLRHLLQSFVDGTTVILDPTAGSGSALWIAEDLGAKASLGLELDPEHAKAAEGGIANRRTLKRLAQGLSADEK